jgi:hypothetical protein
MREVGSTEEGSPGNGMLTDLDWADRYVKESFDMTDQGRIRRSAQEDIPSFLLVRTQHGHLWRFREDLPSQTIMDLARYAGKEAPLRGEILSSPPPERLEPIRRALLVAGLECRITRQRLYRSEAMGEVLAMSWGEKEWEGEDVARRFELFGDVYSFD